ncbi:hypothetical protein ACC760_39460, partial [Rhizobium ruizarguesonis]
LALSLLLSFTLAPILSFLRNRSVPKIAAVLLAFVSAFCAIAVFSIVEDAVSGARLGEGMNIVDQVSLIGGDVLCKVRHMR